MKQAFIEILKNKLMKYNLPIYYDYVFPTFNLPNATKIELGIIDYLYSQHTTVKNNDLFGINSRDEQPLTRTIFGDYLYGYPPCWNTGVSLQSDAFNEFLTIEKNSVYFGKAQKKLKYIYPIGVTPHLHDFVGDKGPGNKLVFEQFWKNISTEALTDIRKGNAVILLDFALENEFPRKYFERLNGVLSESGIPKNQIYLIVNAFNIQETYESWFSEHERKLEVRSFPFLFVNSSYWFSKRTNLYDVDQFLKLKNIIRKNYFLFPIRRARFHRQAVLAKLISDDILHTGNWSFLDTSSQNKQSLIHSANNYGFEIDEGKLDFLISQLPKTLDNEQHENFYSVGGVHENKNDNKESYFYIATETFLKTDYVTLSEKITKPLANFHPFIFLAPAKSLKVLRDIGFKTFSPFIDESYDDEENDNFCISFLHS